MYVSGLRGMLKPAEKPEALGDFVDVKALKKASSTTPRSTTTGRPYSGAPTPSSENWSSPSSGLGIPAPRRARVAPPPADRAVSFAAASHGAVRINGRFGLVLTALALCAAVVPGARGGADAVAAPPAHAVTRAPRSRRSPTSEPSGLRAPAASVDARRPCPSRGSTARTSCCRRRGPSASRSCPTRTRASTTRSSSGAASTTRCPSSARARRSRSSTTATAPSSRP